MAGLGDVDGDGVPDVAITAPWTIVGTALSGRVYVFSGRDGRSLFTWDGLGDAELGHGVRPVGDLDRDGAADLMVSTFNLIGPGGYGMQVLSGRTGTLLREFRCGDAAWVGDVDGDLWPDLLLGYGTTTQVPYAAGIVDLLSGQTNTVLHQFTGTMQYQGLYGTHPAGDVDGDGVPDLMLRAYGIYPFTGPTGIWVHSGRTGSLLYRVAPGPFATNTFGEHVAALGDVNGDGYDDVGLSDHGIATSSNYSHFHVHGGPSGTRLFTFQSTTITIGYYPSGPGDIDGDGFDDVLMTAGANSGPVSLLHSGRDRSILVNLDPGGARTASLGDVDGDDFPDYLIGYGAHQGTNVTRVRVYSGAPDGVTTLGSGCADARGIVPRIGCTYRPARGSRLAINLSRVRSGAPAFLLLGLSATSAGGIPLPYDLAPLGMPGCFVRVAGDAVAFLTSSGPAQKGRAALPLAIPANPLFAGCSLYAQWLVLEPPGASTPASATRALAVLIP